MHLRWENPSCSPNFKPETPRPYSRAACARPEIYQNFHQFPRLCGSDKSILNKNNFDSTLYYIQESSKTTVASRTLPSKGTQPQNNVETTEQPSRNQTRFEPVTFLNCSKNCPTDIQISEQHVTTTLNGDTTTPPLTTSIPLIEEGLVREEQTKKVYLPDKRGLSTVDLKRKQGMLYVPLEFKNNITVDALVDSGAFVSSIAQNDLDTIKEKAPNNILKIDCPPSFQIQVANGQLENRWQQPHSNSKVETMCSLNTLS